MLIPIIYEDDDFIAVNKPVGVSMHQNTQGNAEGICQIISTQQEMPTPYLVHRLDTPTSGCLLLAKTKDAASMVNIQFKNRSINKYYLAISDKKPKKKQGRIMGEMAKSRNGSYKLLPPNKTPQSKQDQPSPAVTYFFSEFNSNTGRLFYIKPISGKTHQIRVALKSLGSPILGDVRYKGTLAERLYLHSFRLDFMHRNTLITLQCLPDSDEVFTSQLLSNLQDPSAFNWPKKAISNQLR